MEDEMNKLDTTLNSVTDYSNKINTALYDKRAQISKLAGVHTLLHKVKCVRSSNFALWQEFFFFSFCLVVLVRYLDFNSSTLLLVFFYWFVLLMQTFWRKLFQWFCKRCGITYKVACTTKVWPWSLLKPLFSVVLKQPNWPLTKKPDFLKLVSSFNGLN